MTNNFFKGWTDTWIKHDKPIIYFFSKSLLSLKIIFYEWIPVSSTGKVSDGYIRNLGFNPRLHQKLIGVLVWW